MNRMKSVTILVLVSYFSMIYFLWLYTDKHYVVLYSLLKTLQRVLQNKLISCVCVLSTNVWESPNQTGSCSLAAVNGGRFWFDDDPGQELVYQSVGTRMELLWRKKKTLNVISTYNNLAAINTTYTDLPRLASGEFLLLFDALPAWEGPMPTWIWTM